MDNSPSAREVRGPETCEKCVFSLDLKIGRLGEDFRMNSPLGRTERQNRLFRKVWYIYLFYCLDSSTDDSAKQRHRLTMKLMGSSPGLTNPADIRETYKERFLPPELSMVTYFMTKVRIKYPYPLILQSRQIFSHTNDSGDEIFSMQPGTA